MTVPIFQKKKKSIALHSPLSKTTKMLLKSLRKCWAPYYEEKNEGQEASSISILLMTSSTAIRTTHTTPPNHTVPPVLIVGKIEY